MAEASGGRTHRRRGDPPPAGFEDRDDHRTACASGKAATDSRSPRIRTEPIAANKDPCSSALIRGLILFSRSQHICRGYFGCGTILRYGLGDFHPPGYFCCASSFDTEGRMITSSPCFQFTGVATLCFAVSCIESMTRSISSKLRPVLIG